MPRSPATRATSAPRATPPTRGTATATPTIRGVTTTTPPSSPTTSRPPPSRWSRASWACGSSSPPKCSCSAASSAPTRSTAPTTPTSSSSGTRPSTPPGARSTPWSSSPRRSLWRGASGRPSLVNAACSWACCCSRSSAGAASCSSRPSNTTPSSSTTFNSAGANAFYNVLGNLTNPDEAEHSAEYIESHGSAAPAHGGAEGKGGHGGHGGHGNVEALGQPGEPSHSASDDSQPSKHPKDAYAADGVTDENPAENVPGDPDAPAAVAGDHVDAPVEDSIVACPDAGVAAPARRGRAVDEQAPRRPAGRDRPGRNDRRAAGDLLRRVVRHRRRRDPSRASGLALPPVRRNSAPSTKSGPTSSSRSTSS